MRRRLIGPAAALALVTLTLSARPAQAIITGQEALAIAEKIKKAYDFIMGVGDLVNPKEDLAVLIKRNQAALIDELHAIRDDEVESLARGVLERFHELVTNPVQDWSQPSNETFYLDSLTSIQAMHNVLIKRRTREDLPSVYDLAQVYNLVVSARALAMKNAGEICGGFNQGPCTPFDQSAFDNLLNEATDINHNLVGVTLVAFDNGQAPRDTIHWSSLWQKYSDYVFRIPNQPFVFCGCNVWEWACKPLGAPGTCVQDWTFLLPPEQAKIEGRFFPDPVVEVTRNALLGLVDGGHVRVNTLNGGPGTILVF
jgi:hypothetical protein